MSSVFVVGVETVRVLQPSRKQVGDQGSGEEAQGWEEVPNSQIAMHDVQFATCCTSLQSQNSCQP